MGGKEIPVIYVLWFKISDYLMKYVVCLFFSDCFLAFLVQVITYILDIISMKSCPVQYPVD